VSLFGTLFPDTNIQAALNTTLFEKLVFIAEFS
jgi:hypothetical protein